MTYPDFVEIFDRELTKAIASNDSEAIAEKLFAAGRAYANLSLNLWCAETNREFYVAHFENFTLSLQDIETILSTLPGDIDSSKLDTKAEAFFLNALKIHEVKNQDKYGEVCAALGRLYDQMGRWQDKKSFQEIALGVFTKTQNIAALAHLKSDFAHDAAFKEFDFQKANSLLEEAREYFIRLKDRLSEANCLFRQADLLDPQRLEGEFGDLARCKDLMSHAAQIYIEQGEPLSAIRCFAKLGNILAQNSNAEGEEAAFLKAIEIVEAHLPKEHWTHNYEAAADFFAERGNKKKAKMFAEKAEMFRSFQKQA